MNVFLQNAIDAIALGSLYALASLGIGLIFSIMRLVNFAHGAFIAFCIFTMLMPTAAGVVASPLGKLPAPVLLVVVLSFGALLGVLSEIIVFRHLRKASPATMMVASFSVGYVMQNLLYMIYSSRPIAIDLWSGLSQAISAAGLRITLLQIVTIAAAIIVLVALHLFLKHTRFGLEMRAAAERFETAELLGVAGNRVIMIAFALSGVLAGLTALILLAQTGVASISIGIPVVFVAFIACVLGGLGNLTGAVLGGFLIGIFSVVMQIVLPVELRPYRDAFVYFAVVAVLMVKPMGLFPPLSAKGRV